MLRYVRNALTAAGFAPIVTGDPRDLSRIFKEGKLRLVVLDLTLPKTDGIEYKLLRVLSLNEGRVSA